MLVVFHALYIKRSSSRQGKGPVSDGKKNARGAGRFPSCTLSLCVLLEDKAKLPRAGYISNRESNVPGGDLPQAPRATVTVQCSLTTNQQCPSQFFKRSSSEKGDLFLTALPGTATISHCAQASLSPKIRLAYSGRTYRSTGDHIK